ncbi:hypothetical protein EV421DRAFT_2036514 [Armillaria borealis]|uniref:HNH nuclease domain-containing protein n=1 Tax=Armillaria borealis TaxID=47425 RepID=A0AA39JEQ2_9AGAR|nr:hypothetical protein EV421DRAFT_2036514 [Armillaria borealis]
MADSHGPRPPLEPRTDHVEPIYIYHPVRKGPFLSLGRRQKVFESGEERLGIRHWFILDACLVIAGKGFLSSTPESTGRVDLEENGFLTARRYWFFLSDGAAHLDYPVCNNFLEWTPLARQEVAPRWLAIDEPDRPTTNPPLESSFSDISLVVRYTDGYCAISGLNEELRACHLVPQACADWYACHGIYRHFAHGEDYLNITSGPGARPVDDVRQILTLESGLHECTDRPSFVIAPSPPSDKYVCYFFTKRPIGLAEDYHMRTAKIPSRIQGYALFARFAWAMIQVALSLPSCETPVKRRSAEDYDAEDGPDWSPTIGGTHATDGVVEPSSTGDSWVEANVENLDAGFGVQTESSHSDANHHNDDSFSNTHDECSEHDLPSVNPFREREWKMTPSEIQRFKDAKKGLRPFSSFVYDAL